jgi:hypothetical protein
MNWEAVGASAELLAAVGVIVSLLYLAAQIRQNTRSVRASTFQDFTRESADTTRLLLLEKSLIDELTPVLRGEREFEPERDQRFGLLAGLYARNLQFAFLESQDGRIDRRQFDSYVSYHAANMMLRPGWSNWWALNRQHYHPEFVLWVEEMLAA